MEISVSDIKDKLIDKGLKVTPQRIAILDAIYSLGNHPTAEMIKAFIKDTHPGISPATVYKVLDALVENKLIKKVNTEKDVMRYDGILENHHHLYCSESNEIKDYSNEKLDQLLATFFRKHRISDFRIDEIKVQINGKFSKPKKQIH